MSRIFKGPVIGATEIYTPLELAAVAGMWESAPVRRKSHIPIRGPIKTWPAASPHLLSLLAFIFHPVKITRSLRGLVPIKHGLLGIVVPANHEYWEQLDPMTRHIPIRLFQLSGSRFLGEALGRVLRKTADILAVGTRPYSVDAPLEIIESTCDVLLTDSV
jgi:hypothetical protein